MRVEPGTRIELVTSRLRSVCMNPVSGGSIAFRIAMDNSLESKFAELKERTQANLVAFLSTELELAQTLFWSAELEADPQAQARRFLNVINAIAAIRRFEGKIHDAALRQKLQAEVDSLQKRLDTATAKTARAAAEGR